MSYFDVKAKKEKLGEVQANLKAISDKAVAEQRPFSAEEITMFDSCDAERKQLQAEIASAERVQSVVAPAPVSMNQPVYHVAAKKTTKNQRNNALRAWALFNGGAADKISVQMRRDADECELNLNAASISMDAPTDPLTDDAYTVNAGLVSGVTNAREYNSELRQVCQNITTEKGGALPFLYVDDNAKKGVVTAKSLGGFASDGLTFEKTTINDFLITTGAFPIPMPMITDSAIDLTSYVSGLLGKRLARTETDLFINGRGTGGTPEHEPVGLSTLVTPALWYPSTDVAWFDVLAALIGDAGVYADAPNSAFVMAPATWAEIMRTVDSIGRPLFAQTVNTAGQRQILGKPVKLVPYITNTVYFGDFSQVVIRNVGSVEIVVLRELFRQSYNAIGLLANSRCDIGLIDPDAVVAATVSTASGESNVNCGLYVTAE